MKKFRLLAAMVITVAMLFTVALAADVAFDAVEYDGAADTITVVAKTTKALDIDAYSAWAINYDSDVLEYASASSCDAAAELKDYAGRFEWANPSGDTAAAEGAALLTLVFNVKDKAAVVGSTIETNEGLTFCSAYDAGGDILDMVTSVTVKAAKTPAAIVAGIPAYQTYTGATGQVYNNVWYNTYTVTPNGNTVTAITLAFNGNTKTVAAVEAEGDGNLVFDIAIVGATTDAEVAADVVVAE